jgi:hypothetical protein
VNRKAFVIPAKSRSRRHRWLLLTVGSNFRSDLEGSRPEKDGDRSRLATDYAKWLFGRLRAVEAENLAGDQQKVARHS